MRILLYLIIVVVVACTFAEVKPSSKKTNYQVSIRGYDFPLVVEEFAEDVSLHLSEGNGAPLRLKPTAENPQVKTGRTDEEGNLWNFGLKDDATTVYSVSFAPYYSFYSYSMLSALRATGEPKLSPDCPIETKYLVIFFVSVNNYPLAGCVK